MTPSRRSAFERLYATSYRHREATVHLAHILADAIDLYEECSPTATSDDLADLTAGITDDFASIRSSIIMFAPHTRPESP